MELVKKLKMPWSSKDKSVDLSAEDPVNSGNSDDSESEEGGDYDPAEFESLPVDSEVKEMFKIIAEFTPTTIELGCVLKPFIPEFIPAVGDPDAFIKATRPDDIDDNLGLSVLDEPAADQSDPAAVDMQLRVIHAASLSSSEMEPKRLTTVGNSESSASGKEIDSWIRNISDIQRSKAPTTVNYSRPMPSIDTLMQEWPDRVESQLKTTQLPTADLDCSLAEYADVILALMDIPVHKSRVQSLHVLFSLYAEFKNSQHFKSLAFRKGSDHWNRTINEAEPTETLQL